MLREFLPQFLKLNLTVQYYYLLLSIQRNIYHLNYLKSVTCLVI